MKLFLVWRSSRPWEHAHMHLDSVCAIQSDADARVERIKRAPSRTRIDAFVEQLDTNEPRDRSLIGDW